MSNPGQSYLSNEWEQLFLELERICQFDMNRQDKISHLATKCASEYWVVSKNI